MRSPIIGLIYSELLLGYNLFETGDSQQTIQNILELPLPNFTDLRPDVDEHLNHILHRALERSREGRFQSAEEMLSGLENFIYGDGYGPTNEKLAAYCSDLFSSDGHDAATRWYNGETQYIES